MCVNQANVNTEPMCVNQDRGSRHSHQDRYYLAAISGSRFFLLIYPSQTSLFSCPHMTVINSAELATAAGGGFEVDITYITSKVKVQNKNRKIK